MKFIGTGWTATALVVAVIAVYAVYVASDGVWLIQDTRDIAIVGLVGGILCRLVGYWEAFSPHWPVWSASSSHSASASSR